MLKFMKNENKKKSSNDEQSCEVTIEDAEKIVNEDDSAFTRTNIKLHRNLLDILNDKTILSFFIQYLESKNGLPLVKFWLDVETFKAVGETSSSFSNSDRTESRASHYKNSTECCKNDDCVSISTTTTSTSNIEEIDEFVDEVDNNMTITMTQSLTDDEKFKICEKNRKNDECEAKSNQLDEDTKKFQPMIIEDALRIFRKYLVTDSTYSIELPAMILGKLSLALCGNNDSESDMDLNNLWCAFEDAQKFIFDIMEREYLQEFLESSFYCKYTIDVLTSESLCLAEILCSETALFYFMEFLEQEDNSKLSYLEFWLNARNFRKQEELSSDQLRTDALVIYEKWFSLQATNSLKFSNKTRTKVEEQICADSIEQLLKCFDEPIKIVEIFLDRNCFKKFIKSQLFFKHLSEVMGKIDNGIERNLQNGIIRRNSSFAIKFPSNKHRRTNSESLEKKGVTRSISAQNTLLAGLDHKRNKTSTDLQIDSRQLIDPNLLWRRQNANTKLSFGKVDHIGRYLRDFEMPNTIPTSNIPQSKSSFQLQNDSIDVDDPQSIFEQAKLSSAQNRLKNAVRKLVHLPEDSMQQEIAWQVAELIVKDVTSITLQNENHSS
ncbi:hypothetical protein PVAND_004733 [Polypedilum vanderplanki]|uniref:RGS domain-containing protein n=1 Tax=Polypedilum vanderplanki TaxID=319348 RepID=A0A9J6BYM5_POLVA|nr:hypothetical protein PVAND_004733 [Polypedilum vanderplanki]